MSNDPKNVLLCVSIKENAEKTCSFRETVFFLREIVI